MVIQPDILVVPQSLARIAHRLLNEKLVCKIGNYSQYGYDNKTYWVKTKHHLNLTLKKRVLEDMIRGGYNDSEEYKSVPSLPQSMKKNGYKVEAEYVGYGDYVSKIVRSDSHR